MTRACSPAALDPGTARRDAALAPPARGRRDAARPVRDCLAVGRERCGPSANARRPRGQGDCIARPSAVRGSSTDRTGALCGPGHPNGGEAAQSPRAGVNDEGHGQGRAAYERAAVIHRFTGCGRARLADPAGTQERAEEACSGRPTAAGRAGAAARPEAAGRAEAAARPKAAGAPEAAGRAAPVVRPDRYHAEPGDRERPVRRLGRSTLERPMIGGTGRAAASPRLELRRAQRVGR
jgi:hypothetical protein